MRMVGGKIEFKVQRIPRPFPESLSAVCVWPFIWYEEHVYDDPCLQVHERYHWQDQLRWLVIPWFIVYGILRPFQRGGTGHFLEREAYARAEACRAAADN
jgi:hypothetical protein